MGWTCGKRGGEGEECQRLKMNAQSISHESPNCFWKTNKVGHGATRHPLCCDPSPSGIRGTAQLIATSPLSRQFLCTCATAGDVHGGERVANRPSTPARSGGFRGAPREVPKPRP